MRSRRRTNPAAIFCALLSIAQSDSLHADDMAACPITITRGHELRMPLLETLVPAIAARVPEMLEAMQLERDAARRAAQAAAWEPKDCDWRTEPFPSINPNWGLKEDPSSDPRCPDGTERVANFCMDRFSGSLEVVHDDGTREPWSPYHNPKRFHAGKVRAVSLRGAIAQGNISGIEAAEACRNAGKRLCSGKEWLRACQGDGPKPRMYPYGGVTEADAQPGLCNDIPRKVHPSLELWLSIPPKDRPGKSSDDGPYLVMQNACVLQRPNTVIRNGALDKCKTPEGVYDLVGNLHEWTNERRANGNGVFRGGYFMDTRLNKPGCSYATLLHAPEHWDYSTGFRCCANLKPLPENPPQEPLKTK